MPDSYAHRTSNTQLGVSPKKKTYFERTSTDPNVVFACVSHDLHIHTHTNISLGSDVTNRSTKDENTVCAHLTNPGRTNRRTSQRTHDEKHAFCVCASI